MDENKINKTGENNNTPETKEKYERPEVGTVKKPLRSTFACEPCEHEHDGAASRCSGL